MTNWTRKTNALFLSIVCVVFLWGLSAPAAQAIEVQTIKTPKGIEAWLVEDHSIPLIAMRIAFPGGAALDPKDRAGLANLTASLLDEGAGPLDSKAFQKRLKELAVRLSFSAGKDWLFARLQTLSKNKNEAFSLLRQALVNPRFDDEPVSRVRSQIAVSIKRDNQNPGKLAGRAFMKLVLSDHPYARPTSGTLATLKAITKADMKRFTKNRIVRSGIKISVVGDITADELASLLDDALSWLPARGTSPVVKEAVIQTGPAEKFIKVNIPQTVIRFGHKGFKMHDKDFIPAYIINYVLGGGGLTSRLTHEIREKRGLTYSVFSYLHPMRKAALFLGGASTRADRAALTIKLIRAEIKKMALHGPTKQELQDAKTYLVGSYALRFDTNTKIARQLLGIQVENLGLDYIKRRNGLIKAVTIKDVKRVAKRLLKPGALLFSIVGKTPPEEKTRKSENPAKSPVKKPL